MQKYNYCMVKLYNHNQAYICFIYSKAVKERKIESSENKFEQWKKS